MILPLLALSGATVLHTGGPGRASFLPRHISFDIPVMATTNPDEAFEADAEAEVWADARRRLRSRQSRHESHGKKPDNRMVDHSIDEQTALLLGHPEESSDAIPDNDGDNNVPEWSGARDFEGMPWWRTPSVRTTSQPRRRGS